MFNVPGKFVKVYFSQIIELKNLEVYIYFTCYIKNINNFFYH